MCGRVTLTSTIEEISSTFVAKFDMEQARMFRTGFNVAPTHRLCVINNEDGQRVGKVMRWGLIPPYVKKLDDFKLTTFNARAEGLLKSQIYKGPFKEKRCIIIISGYYEWRDEGDKSKQPYYFKPSEGETLALAGLWERTTLIQGDGSPLEIESCTIITTEPNEVTSEYHNRMPVILMPKDFDTWMSPDTTQKELLSLLKACPPDYLEIIKVDKRVGRVSNDGPENIRPVDDNTELAF